LYGLARQQHAELSGPVNQAKILNAMQETLAGNTGGERANAFLNVLGKGENALLKRADQNPRFGGLEEALTTKQMSAVNKVAGELTRDAKIADEASKGAVALRAILDENKSKLRLPNFMSAKATVANETIGILEGKLDKKVLAALKKGFESGANMEKLLSTVPAKDRNMFLAAMSKAKSGLSPEKLNALGLSANALSSEPVRIELNNMATGRP
jgi:isochorismate synthase EntC